MAEYTVHFTKMNHLFLKPQGYSQKQIMYIMFAPLILVLFYVWISWGEPK